MYIVYLDIVLLPFNRLWHSVKITFICPRKPKPSSDSLYLDTHFIVGSETEPAVSLR